MRQDPSYSEMEYARLFQEGDELALGYFFREFHPALSLFANRWVNNRALAEEIAADAFVKTWKMHGKLNSYPGIRAYLYKVVRRDSLHVLKKEQKRVKAEKTPEIAEIIVDTPYENMIRSEVYRMIHDALKYLSPATRKVLIMHYLDGKTTGQIASELNLHPSTIKTQKSKGLESLRKQLLRPLIILLYLFSKIFLNFS